MIDEIAFYWGVLSTAPDFDLVLAAALAALLAGAGAHATIARRRRVSTVILLALASVLGTGAIGAAATFAHLAREVTLAASITGVTRENGRAFEFELGWLMLAAGIALFLTPALGAAITRTASRPATRVLSGGVTVLGTFAAWVASTYLSGFVWALASILEGCVPRFDSRAERLAFLVDGLAALDRALLTGTVAMLALALATIVVALRRRGGRPLFTNRALALSAVVFAAGLTAFVATRDHAWDRQHPQRLSDRGWYDEDRLEPIGGMRLACTHPEIGPVLGVDEGSVSVDGRLAPTPARLAEELATVRRKWQVLHPNDSFGGVIILRVDPDTRLAPLAPYLERAAAAGYVSLIVDAETEIPVSTRTLGVVRARRVCPVRVELEAGSDPLPATVAELVHAIQRGRATLAVGH